MIRVLIADDHPIVRKGMKEILADTSDIIVAGEADNGDDVLEKVRNNGFNIIVLDISMPGKNWLDVISELKEERPEVAILVLSRHSEHEYAIRALRAGANGYLTKSTIVEELIDAIRLASAGRKYISSFLADKMINNLAFEVKKKGHENLTSQEFKVMNLIALGKSTKEISKDLSLARSTISTYRARILKKLGLKSNTDIIQYAKEHQLLD